jgi:thioesterase domain-containing protein/acyl carrier protein
LEELLSVKSIGVKDNFFDLGGHSLLAVRLFAEIEKTLRKRLPVSTLFRSSTIEELALVLREEKTEALTSSLLPIQTEGTGIPIFCVAPVADRAIGFAALARALGPDQPFYGLQFPVTDESPSATSIEEMATLCIGEIETAQPDGPYLLGGACLGGFVAFEMACQLHRDGRRVPLLFILDSSQPPPLITLREYIPRLLFHHLPRGEMFFCLKKDLTEKTRKYKRMLSRSQEDRRFYQVWKSHEDARRAYMPKPYPGRLTVFQSREFHIRFPEYLARWEALACGGLDHHIIPCGHRETLRDPHVRIIAEGLKVCLAGMQT